MTTATAPAVRPASGWTVPTLLLLAALAWVGGTFSASPAGLLPQLLVVVAHVVPVVVVGGALVASIRRPDSTVWPRVLLGVCCCIKALTVFAIVWGLTHPTGFGPRGVLDWIPIGAANAGSGLVLLQFIRSRGNRA